MNNLSIVPKTATTRDRAPIAPLGITPARAYRLFELAYSIPLKRRTAEEIARRVPCGGIWTRDDLHDGWQVQVDVGDGVARAFSFDVIYETDRLVVAICNAPFSYNGIPDGNHGIVVVARGTETGPTVRAIGVYDSLINKFFDLADADDDVIPATPLPRWERNAKAKAAAKAAKAAGRQFEYYVEAGE